MQLLLVLGIAFAIAAVMFALQNNVAVTVTFAVWRFDSTIAMVLLLALGLGVIIAGLVSSPSMIKARWSASRLSRQSSKLENDNAVLTRRVAALETELAKLRPPAATDAGEPKLYVGLKTLILGGKSEKPDN